MSIAKVIVPQNNLPPLLYKIPKELDLCIGNLVNIPIRNKRITAIISDIISGDDEYIKKYIKSHIGRDTDLKNLEIGKINAQLDKNFIRFIYKVSKYYVVPISNIVKMVLPIELDKQTKKITKKSSIKYKQEIDLKNISLANLSEDQKNIFNDIVSADKTCVIKGVTGSGKTEIYFHLVLHYLKQGGQILIMLPEIALSTQIIKRFKQRFNIEAAIWNSETTDAKKRNILQGLINGDVKIIIGARSALFLPYKNLQLIIVDEEHDLSYKQTEAVPYHARNMAVLRSHMCNTKTVLISATPSIETINNSNIGKYKLFELKRRFANATLPIMEIINMREEKKSEGNVKKILSEKLIEKIYEKLSKKEQILLFLNRRGYAPMIICNNCGYNFECDNCSKAMVFHKASGKMKCHFCTKQIIPQEYCIKCEEKNSLNYCGVGVEMVAEYTQNLFPQSKIAILSTDYKNKEIKNTLDQIESGEIDIVIGTQIISKGYHFPHMTLIGIIDIDVGLFSSNFRAGEYLYQLLKQVSGRVGREKKQGTVLIQSYYPENKLLKNICSNNEKDEQEFITMEIENRKLAQMPPFGHMIFVMLSGKDCEKTLKFAKKLICIIPKTQNVNIWGPIEAMIHKVANKYRFYIMITTNKNFNIQQYISSWINSIEIPSYCKMKIDIEPYHFA